MATSLALWEKPILTMTNEAGAHLARQLELAVQEASQTPEGATFRLARRQGGQGGLELQLDKAQPDDTTLDHEGRTVLVTDPEVAQSLEEKTISVKQTDQGLSLVLD